MREPSAAWRRDQALEVPAADAPALIIVRRGHADRFRALSEAFAQDRDVRVIWDRRGPGGHRAPKGANASEGDRRHGFPESWDLLDFLVVLPRPRQPVGRPG